MPLFVWPCRSQTDVRLWRVDPFAITSPVSGTNRSVPSRRTREYLSQPCSKSHDRSRTEMSVLSRFEHGLISDLSVAVIWPGENFGHEETSSSPHSCAFFHSWYREDEMPIQFSSRYSRTNWLARSIECKIASLSLPRGSRCPAKENFDNRRSTMNSRRSASNRAEHSSSRSTFLQFLDICVPCEHSYNWFGSWFLPAVNSGPLYTDSRGGFSFPRLEDQISKSMIVAFLDPVGCDQVNLCELLNRLMNTFRCTMLRAKAILRFASNFH